MRAVFHILLVSVAVGCTPKSSTSTQVVQTTNAVVILDEARAIAIARQAVSTNDTWVARATFEARRDGSGWSVSVERWPQEIGGHRLVKIDPNGKVTAYYRGR
ncbi:MAG: hypothetical protein WCS99_08520 [Limisphaerales bacterium]